jgi:hypothetical protein
MNLCGCVWDVWEQTQDILKSNKSMLELTVPFYLLRPVRGEMSLALESEEINITMMESVLVSTHHLRFPESQRFPEGAFLRLICNTM